jgi:carboxymethylenebutenolidase
VAIAGLLGVLIVMAHPSPGSGATAVGVKNNISAIFFAPDGPGPFPGVLVLATSAGVKQADRTFAGRLAGEGYVCLVPSYLEAYGAIGDERSLGFTTYASQIYADFVQAADVLKHHDKVGGGKVGVVGFSNGGYFAMWLAATGKIQAGVSYYGALSGNYTDNAQTRFRGVFTAHSSPVLILHGEQDRTVPVRAARRLVGILQAAGAPYEAYFYPGADHRFERGGDAAATADAWQRTLAFLGKYLKQQ